MAKTPNKLLTIITSLLFVLIAVLRLWRATDWFSFNYDEEYQAFLAWSQVLHPHPIWIGVSASNFGFYLGPAFTYLNSILFALSKGDLAILAIFSPLLGILTTFSILYIVSNIFSKRAGIFSALIYGFSPLLNFFDRRFWNPTPIPFLSVWFVYSLYKAEKNTRWYILTAAIMATILHVHLSLVVFWPLVIICLLKNFKKIKISTWMFSIITYATIVSPLIVFDLVHNFDDLLGPIRYFLSPDKQSSVIGISPIIGHASSVFRSIGRIIALGPGTTIQDEMFLGIHGNAVIPSTLISLMVFIPFLWIILKIRREKQYTILLVSALSIAFAFMIYPASSVEYFLLGSMTLYTIIIGIFLSKIPMAISSILILVLGLFSTFTILSTNQTKYGLNVRKELIKQVQNKTSKSEIIVGSKNTDGEVYPTHAGWCYLFRSMGTIPNSCQADTYFGWIYPLEVRGNNHKYQIIISEDPHYVQTNKQSEIVKSGVFTAEIIPIKK